MAVVPLDIPPVSQPHRYYGYAGGRDKNFSGHQLANTGFGNLVRNGYFSGWSQGVSARPDAWDWTANGATLFRNNTAANTYWGPYCARVSKTLLDPGDSYLYQDVKNNPTITKAIGMTFTFSVMVKTDQSSFARAYFYDGTSYQYSNWHTGGDAYEELWLSFCPPSGSTELQVGVQVEQPGVMGPVYAYVDHAMLVYGWTPGRYIEHVNDRAPICQDWDSDGSHKIVRGNQRIIPFKVVDTLTGGTPNETIAVTLTYGCRLIQAVLVNLYSTSGGAKQYFNVSTQNYSTTGFDISCDYGLGNLGAWTVDIRGAIYCIGWDVPAEQWL